MQYLVSEVLKTASTPGAAKIFDTIPEALKYIQKVSKTKSLRTWEQPVTEEVLLGLLGERLVTVTVFAAEADGRKWVITAF